MIKLLLLLLESLDLVLKRELEKLITDISNVSERFWTIYEPALPSIQ